MTKLRKEFVALHFSGRRGDRRSQSACLDLVAVATTDHCLAARALISLQAGLPKKAIHQCKKYQYASN